MIRPSFSVGSWALFAKLTNPCRGSIVSGSAKAAAHKPETVSTISAEIKDAQLVPKSLLGIGKKGLVQKPSVQSEASLNERDSARAKTEPESKGPPDLDEVGFPQADPQSVDAWKVATLRIVVSCFKEFDSTLPFSNHVERTKNTSSYVVFLGLRGTSRKCARAMSRSP